MEAPGPIRGHYCGQVTNQRTVLWPVDQSEASIYSALPSEAAGAAAGAGDPRHLGGAGAQPRAAPCHGQWSVLGFLNFDVDICAFVLDGLVLVANHLLVNVLRKPLEVSIFRSASDC